MQTLVDGLTEGEEESLRRAFQLVEPTSWVIAIAHQKSWREANERFLKHERDRGREDMQRLMTTLGVEKPVPAGVAADLVAAAVTLYVPVENAEGCVERLGPGSLKVRIGNCPVFRRLEANKLARRDRLRLLAPAPGLVRRARRGRRRTGDCREQVGRRGLRGLDRVSVTP